MPSCPHCGADLDSLVACGACQALLDVPRDASPFEVLGLPQAFRLEPRMLEKRLLTLSRRVHPDFFGHAPEEQRRRAERNSAELNAAHRILADELSRADWLVAHLGGPRENEERAMPPEFLQEVLEWNETIEEARASAPGSTRRDDLESLARQLDLERTSRMRAVANRLDPLPEPRSPALAAVRKDLNAVRYLDRSRRDIAELRLERAPNPA